MTDSSEALFALANQLNVHGYDAAQQGDHIVVVEPNTSTCFTIRCGPRASDKGRLWFYADSGDPMAEADQVVNALMAVKGHLKSESW